MWKRQYISKGGRLSFIRSTLSNMPIYYMSILCMPRSVRLRLEQIQRDFLWGGGALKRKTHLIDYCFMEEREALWKQVISRKYGVEEGVDPSVEEGSWSSRFSKAFNDWEVVLVERLLMTIQEKVNAELEDRVVWKKTKSGIFTVKSLYSAIEPGNTIWFLRNIIWCPYVPPEVAEDQSTNHILIHYTKIRVLWELLFALFGVTWFLPCPVRKTLLGWYGSFVGKKRKKSLEAGSFMPFLGGVEGNK
ncbi:putative ribonuclease H protein [Vitis vinifera]|uniref:Putative ribonuclease H protein n=1 Tax=Vitis vinifera TaxID=29760 RepID=A0A438H579_VITVI|nr:putative ribonuclease H protein [Vitis vinifera]